MIGEQGFHPGMSSRNSKPGYHGAEIRRVDRISDGELLQVIHAGDSLRFQFRRRQRRQQQTCKDCNDGYNHQEFNQSERPFGKNRFSVAHINNDADRAAAKAQG